ncbi:hypothetical protein [Reyranella soli]|uniref:hypothetical protein n=1 Tax=Reyranella soli TaxID=1230389 RepID=UPI0011BF0536|nr:hypothetical protein [Reyranella soli]
MSPKEAGQSATARPSGSRHHGQPTLLVRPLGDAVDTTARIASVCHECRGRSRGPIALNGKGNVELIEVVSA